MKSSRIALGVALAVALTFTSVASWAGTARTELVSTTSTGQPANRDSHIQG
jgi:hypothetical protein